MPEGLINDPAVLWMFTQIIGALILICVAIFGYEHRRISQVNVKVGKNDKMRQKKCMTKEQCTVNRDYHKEMYLKMGEGQDKIERAIVDGFGSIRTEMSTSFAAVHARVDDLYKKTTERRIGDRDEKN